MVGNVEKDILEDCSCQSHLVLREKVTKTNSRESDELEIENVGEGESRGAVVIDGGDEGEDK